MAVLITDTVFELLLVTYAADPSGVTATPTGKPPTGMVAVTVLVAVLITDTAFQPALVT
jgi:hypothetical protein